MLRATGHARMVNWPARSMLTHFQEIRDAHRPSTLFPSSYFPFIPSSSSHLLLPSSPPLLISSSPPFHFFSTSRPPFLSSLRVDTPTSPRSPPLASPSIPLLLSSCTCRLTTYRHRFACAAPAPRAKRNCGEHFLKLVLNCCALVC